MMKRFAAMLAVAGMAFPAVAQDTREMVTLPAPMQEHMLASMRDHLDVLNQILADIAAERYSDAGKLAEQRLGMSSFGLHGASHMAPYMPKGMQEAGGALHRASSRFALAAEDADVHRSYDSLKKLTAAISEMTAACSSCHASYRIR